MPAAEPRGPAAWVRRHPITTYYVIAVGVPIFLMAWAFQRQMELEAAAGGPLNWWNEVRAALGEQGFVLVPHAGHFAWLALTGQGIVQAASFVNLAYSMMPTVATLIVVVWIAGARGLRETARLFRPCNTGLPARRVALLYAGVFGVWLLATAYGFLVTALVQGPEALAANLSNYGTASGSFITSGNVLGFMWMMMSFALLQHGGLFEELGWRGFVQPRLQARFSPMTTVFILTVLWQFWHLPRDLPQFLPGIGFGVAYVSITMVHAFFLTIYFNWLRNVTGSVLIAMIAHSLMNFAWLSAMPQDAFLARFSAPQYGEWIMTGAIILFEAALAAWVIARAGWRLGLPAPPPAVAGAPDLSSPAR
jgi:membrane protease YdiL (CAAX protease family)